MKNKDKLIGVKEIARRANVSLATVDRVIHKRTGVAPKTKKKIEAIIKELNYQPNILASRLASGKVFELAVLIPKGSHETDFWDAPLNGIKRAESEIKQYGIRVKIFLFDLNDKNSFSQQAKLIQDSKIDGVLISPSFIKESVEFVKHCKSRNIPYVFIDTNIAEYEGLSYIGPHLFQSGYLGAKLSTLVVKENVKILMVNISKEIENYNFSQIEKGFKAYYKDNNKKNKIVRLDITDPNYQSVSDNMDTALKSHPDTAVIFVPNSRVFSIARYFEAHHVSNVHLIGYDLLEENVHYLKKEIIDFLICHKPEDQGYKGIMSLYHHLALGLGIEKVNFMPIDIITKENQQFYK